MGTAVLQAPERGAAGHRAGLEQGGHEQGEAAGAHAELLQAAAQGGGDLGLRGAGD